MIAHKNSLRAVALALTGIAQQGLTAPQATMKQEEPLFDAERNGRRFENVPRPFTIGSGPIDAKTRASLAQDTLRKGQSMTVIASHDGVLYGAIMPASCSALDAAAKQGTSTWVSVNPAPRPGQTEDDMIMSTR